MSVLTVPINSGSSKINKWASKIAALSAPKFSWALSLIIVNSFLEISIASSKRLTSATTSWTLTSLTVKFGSTKMYALAKDIPWEAAIPFSCNILC